MNIYKEVKQIAKCMDKIHHLHGKQTYQHFFCGAYTSPEWAKEYFGGRRK